MKSFNRQQTAAVRTPRTRRNHVIAAMTSIPAGVCTPIAAIPMLREDALRGSISMRVEMMETAELLANPVSLRATAYLVPWLAMERFEGSRDQFDRSYMGEPQVEGGDVVPFIETLAMGTHGANAVYKHLGLHAPTTRPVNTMYLEAYNLIWNFRAKNRSRDIPERARLATTLAPAFWNDSRFMHVVPDFDQAVIDGEVALSFVSSQVPVRGLFTNNAAQVADGTYKRTADGGDVTMPGPGLRALSARPYGGLTPDEASVFAELEDSGVAISLADIAMAKKAQWFAKLRERFEAHDDEWIIDMLMAGLTIPEQHLKQPILIADQTVPFAQVKRYATDADNLTQSAVSGGAAIGFDLNVPRLSTGGIVMVIVEAMPQQLFERQYDPFFYLNSDNYQDSLPDYVRDELDPEKVDVVSNGHIDVAHANPTGVFGYAPMNWKWASNGPRIGGKFYRPTTDAGTDSVRQRFWAIENIDPVLSEDFYLVNDIHIKPFLDQETDPFEAAVSGGVVLEGNTVFGGLLVEATNNYDRVLEKAPTERIEKEA